VDPNGEARKLVLEFMNRKTGQQNNLSQLEKVIGTLENIQKEFNSAKLVVNKFQLQIYCFRW
jgi:catalase (peroxidase I)